jgi:hypothetical protein
MCPPKASPRKKDAAAGVGSNRPMTRGKLSAELAKLEPHKLAQTFATRWVRVGKGSMHFGLALHFSTPRYLDHRLPTPLHPPHAPSSLSLSST